MAFIDLSVCPLFCDGLLGGGISETEVKDEEIDLLLAQRKAARDRKDWAESDRLRSILLEANVFVKDCKLGQFAYGGSAWKAIQYSQKILALEYRVSSLAWTVQVLERRETSLGERLARLVKENLDLRYGVQQK